MSTIIIKTLHSNEEFEEFIKLQRIVWNYNDYRDCVPTHMLLAVSQSGGVILGAYDNDKLVGMGFLMVGYLHKDGLYYHSHFVGIHPDYQHKGIGMMIKKAQYDKALSMGVNKITWTYDPLLGPNAQLNIRKLGAIVRNYKLNVYGETKSTTKPDASIPSDRFWVEWLINTPRVKQRIEGNYPSVDLSYLDIKQVNEVEHTIAGFKKMVTFAKYPEEKNVFIEIPFDFQAIFDTDIELALDWRLKSREMFQYYFSAGFVVVDFQTIRDDSGHKNIYRLTTRIEDIYED